MRATAKKRRPIRIEDSNSDESDASSSSSSSPSPPRRPSVPVRRPSTKKKHQPRHPTTPSTPSPTTALVVRIPVPEPRGRGVGADGGGAGGGGGGGGAGGEGEQLEGKGERRGEEEEDEPGRERTVEKAVAQTMGFLVKAPAPLTIDLVAEEEAQNRAREKMPGLLSMIMNGCRQDESPFTRSRCQEIVRMVAAFLRPSINLLVCCRWL